MTELRHVLWTSALACAGTLAIVSAVHQATTSEESEAGPTEGISGSRRATGRLMSLKLEERTTPESREPAEQGGILRAPARTEGPQVSNVAGGPSPTPALSAWGAPGTPEALFDDYRGPQPQDATEARMCRLQALRGYALGSWYRPYTHSLETALRRITPYLRGESLDTPDFWGLVAVLDAELGDVTLEEIDLDANYMTATARKLDALIRARQLEPSN